MAAAAIAPSCALLMQTEIAATASPEAPKTGAPNE
jgi:hypothetical protein